MAKIRWDDIDAIAEREGNAIKNKLQIKRPQGKRITQQRRMHDSGNTKIQTRIDRRYINDQW